MTSKKVNIRGLKDNSNDPTYRYRMERMNLKHETNKTVITNMTNICKDLSRDPDHLLKYIGKSIGCSSKYDAKNNSYYISKKVELKDLEEKLYQYIETYVLCGTCGNPETILDENKKRIKKECNACGETTRIKT
jgi:translation initiation factor 5